MTQDRTPGEGGTGSAGRLLSRRGVLKAAGAAGAAAALTPLAAGAASRPSARLGRRRAAMVQDRPIRIGWVSPQTGPLAGFGEADAFVLEGVSAAFAGGITVAGASHPVEIIAKDSQSDPNRAATVAGELISDSGIDLMLVASTPETTNPVADQCEAFGVPCISSVAPWQPWFFGRQADPAAPVPFTWTYHFFWGLEDIIAVFLDMWGQVETNKVVGGLFPNDGDGNAWGDPALGFPTPLQAAGYTIVDPGRYENLTSDFSAQISAFKQAGVQILTGVPIPPDFTTFWTQAAQQDFHPLVASVGKALLFPASVEALGDLGEGLSSEVWWSPDHPFTSSLTGQSARELADAYTAFSSKQWTQPIGFGHALFEVAADVLARTASLDDKASIVEAIKATTLDTIVGPVDWTGGVPFPNIAKTPLVGGQWTKGTEFPYDLVIVSNKDHPEIPAAGTLAPIGGSSLPPIQARGVALLELEDVCRAFGRVVVADHLSFRLDAGEALGVVGPNGAGKTSMLDLVTGTLAADSGRILLDGVDVTRLPSHQRARRGVGRTYQVPRPFGGLSAFENVLLGASFAGHARLDHEPPEVAAIDALRVTGLLHRANVMAGGLPLLERKRLELARALATRPRLLLLDEIAGGLTDHEVDQLVGTIRDLRGGGMTIIWIEHVVHALVSVVDRLLAMDRGRRLADGEPRAVMASPEVQAVYLGTEVEG